MNDNDHREWMKKFRNIQLLPSSLYSAGEGSATTASEAPETLTLDTIKEMAAKIGPPPPSIRVQYSEFLDPDDIIEVDTRKFEKIKNYLLLPYSFVEMADIWYIIGKNRIEDFLNEGIHVYGIKKDG